MADPNTVILNIEVNTEQIEDVVGKIGDAFSRLAEELRATGPSLDDDAFCQTVNGVSPTADRPLGEADPWIDGTDYWRRRYMEVSDELAKAVNQKNRETARRKALTAELDGLVTLKHSLFNPTCTTPDVLDLLISNLQRMRSHLRSGA